MKLALATLAAVLLAAPADRHGWVLDDFEDGDLIAAHGLGWIGLGDDLLGGGSRITLSVAPQGAHGSRHALALQGQLGEGPNAFTGASARTVRWSSSKTETVPGSVLSAPRRTT